MQQIKVKIYADKEMSTEIDTWSFDENSRNKIYIQSQENDLLDGEDWWEGYANEIEEKYGNSWNCFEIISSNPNCGRILERDYCINFQKPINYFSWMSKVYLFGDTSWDHLEKNFAGSFIYNVDHQKIEPHLYYRFATDENVISMIKRVVGIPLSKCSVLDVVINPTPTALLALKLAEPYKFPIYIPSKNKLQRLGQLDKARDISEELLSSSTTFMRAIDQFELTDLHFISNCFDSLESLTDKNSPDSLHSRFIDEFLY